MGELQRLLPVAVSSSVEPTIAKLTQPTSSALSDKALIESPVSSNGDKKSRGSAIFSTGLGRRAPRGFQQPGFFQPIARSDMVMDVVVGAGHLLREYPYQYMEVFPQQGWKINDLWDDHDIQTEGEGYFIELLGFLERDNVVRAEKYACDYAHKYPERLNLIGGDIAGLYDKTNPLSIVDKIFVNGESRDFPPVFLWKVAHVLRTNMLAVKAATTEQSNDATSAPALPVAARKDPVLHSTGQATTSEPATVDITTRGKKCMENAALHYD